VSTPKLSFVVLPVDEHRLVLEINDGSGSWQLPIESRPNSWGGSYKK
jgi:hypothetical protein